METYSFFYDIMRVYFYSPFTYLFRKIVVEGYENIPKDKPVIFAPNHQNAILDPLAMIYTTSKQPVFLARGDAFNNKTIGKIFSVFKIMPVYRQRDGLDKLKKNEEIFQKSVNILKNNRAFCLFPEGQHNPQRFLRPLQKAIPRIAFQAEEQSDFNLDIKVIPTGIYYEDKTKSLSILHIHYGKAIDVLDYVEQYKENQQKGMNALKMEISKQLKPLMIDIQDKENYQLYEDSLEIYTPHYLKKNNIKNTPVNRFNASKIIIDKISKIENEEFFAKLSTFVSEIINFSKSVNIPISKLASNNEGWTGLLFKSTILLAFLPLFIVSYLLNFLPHLVPPYISKNLLKDPQYIGSVKFGVGAVVFPIYYLIIFGLSFIFLDTIYAFLFLISLPIIGLFNIHYMRIFKLNKLSYRYLNLTNDKAKHIINSINNLDNYIDNAIGQ